MTEKDFWRNSKVGIIGGGSFGTVLATIASRNCQEVRLWVRGEEQARAINGTRINTRYLPQLQLPQNIVAHSTFERVFEGGLGAVVWVLPSKACRENARAVAQHFTGREILFHATKGIEAGSLKRISEVLREEIPCPRIGVISGPNLADEIGRGLPAATTVASDFNEVLKAGEALFSSDRFRIYQEKDVIGAEWAGTLKNILAIASGALDALQLGWNARAMLITRGLAEMVRFGIAMGAKEETFLGLAGVGDLLATCSSPLSRNYRIGFRLAKGEKLDAVLADLGSTAEGVITARIVREFAQKHRIEMPITEAVYQLLEQQLPAQEAVLSLMKSPKVSSGI